MVRVEGAVGMFRASHQFCVSSIPTKYPEGLQGEAWRAGTPSLYHQRAELCRRRDNGGRFLSSCGGKHSVGGGYDTIQPTRTIHFTPRGQKNISKRNVFLPGVVRPLTLYNFSSSSFLHYTKFPRRLPEISLITPFTPIHLYTLPQYFTSLPLLAIP